MFHESAPSVATAGLFGCSGCQSAHTERPPAVAVVLVVHFLVSAMNMAEPLPRPRPPFKRQKGSGAPLTVTTPPGRIATSDCR